MLKLELSSCVFEIPDDAYACTTLSQNLIGCTTLSQEYSKLIGCYWKIMRKQLSCPVHNQVDLERNYDIYIHIKLYPKYRQICTFKYTSGL